MRTERLPERRGECLRCGVGVGLLVLSIYALSAGGHLYGRDGAAMAEMTTSFVERGSLDVAPGINTLGGRVGRDGRYHTPFGIGQPVLAAPLLRLGRWIGRGSTARYLPLTVLSFFGSLTGALAAGLLTAIAWQLGASRAASVATGLTYALGTLAWPTSSTFYAETLTVCLLFLGLLSGRRALADERYIPALLAGAALMGMIHTRILAASTLPGIFVAWLDAPGCGRRRTRLLVLMGAMAACGLFLWGMRNRLLFGAWLETAYQLEPDGRPRGFTTPLLLGLRILLFSPGKSVLIFAPPAILGAVGLVRARRRRPFLALGLCGSALAVLLTVAQWSQPDGGYCWGPRLMIPGLALLMPGLAFFLDGAARRVRLWSFLIVLVGVMVQIPAVTVSFVEVISAQPRRYATLDYEPGFNPFPKHWTRTILYVRRDLMPRPRALERIDEHRQLRLVNWTGELDFWWVHLRKDGFPATRLWALAGLMAACGLAGALLTWGGLRRSDGVPDGPDRSIASARDAP